MKKVSSIKYQVSSISKHPLFSGSLVMVGGSLIANAVNYLYHLIMGRVLGPVSYGELASIFSILYIISVVPASASFAIVKFISGAADEKERNLTYQTIRTFVIKISAALFVFLLLLTPVISNFLHIKNYFLIALVAPITFINLVTLVNQAASQGVLKFEGSVGPTVISSIAKLILGLVFVFLGFSVFGAVLGVFFAIVLAYLYSVKFVKKFSHISPKGKFRLNRFFKYALPVLLQSFAFTSIFTVDVILVKHFLSPFQAGIYAALSTLGKIIYFAVQPVTATMFPIVSGRKARGEGYKNVFYLSLMATATIALVVVVFYYLFPDLAIGILYGKEYLSAKSDLIWMGVFMLFYTVNYNLANFLISVDKTRVVLLPLSAAFLQIAALSVWHKSMSEVIFVSLGLMIFLFTALSIYMIYNRLASIHGNK